MRRYSAATPHQQCVEVNVEETLHKFNVNWLRENCRCAECYNADTWQKNVLVHQLRGVSVAPGSVRTSGDSLRVTWSDGHTSEYSLSALVQHGSSDDQSRKRDKSLWNVEAIRAAHVEAVQFDDFVNDDSSLKKLLDNVVRYGFGLVTGAPVSVDSTQAAAARICPVQQTLFGRMWTFTSDMSRADTAYTNIALGAHTDTSYFSEPAGIQMFHCLQHDGEAGETLLVDGFHAAQLLRQDHPQHFDFLCRQHVYHEYMEPGYHMRSLDTVLKLHPLDGRLVRLRYNHYDRAARTAMEPERMADLYAALASLSAVVEDPRNELWLKLRPGSILFLDNWRVLHGRAAFTGTRKMCGCYLPRDDWISKARVLQLL